jgi:hypothetical protein
MPSPLPERYQRYAAPDGQRQYQSAEIELYDDRDPVVYVPDAYGQMVPMRKSQVPAAMQPQPVRDLTPIPLVDPQAQKILATGFGIGAAGAGVGFGAGQMFAGIALMGTSGFAILLGLFLLAANLGSRGPASVRKEVHVHQKWFGKTNVNN